MRRRLYWGGFVVLALLVCVPSVVVVVSTRAEGVPSAVVAENLEKSIQAAQPGDTKADQQKVAAELYAKGISPNPGIASVGRDGWAFYSDLFLTNLSQATGARRYSEEEVAAWSESVAGQQKWLATRGIPMYFVVAPASWSIYPDKAPEGMDFDVPHIFDQLLAVRPDLPIIDLRQPLKDARGVADTYSKLNGHWTDFGAYVAWQQIVAKIAAQNPALAPSPPPGYSSVATMDKGNEFVETMNLNVPNPWTYPVLDTPLPDVQVTANDGVTRTLPGSTQVDQLQMPYQSVSLAASSPNRLLTLCDSTCNSVSPYLDSAFAGTMQVRHIIDQPEARPNLPYLIDTYKPNLVVYFMTERTLDKGLTDGPMWAAANAFDAAVPVGSWSATGTATAVNLDAQPTEASPASISWPRQSGAKDVLRVDLDAQNFGQLQVNVGSGKDAKVVSVQYPAGKSEVFLQVPASAAGSSLALQLAAGSGAVTVSSVEVRQNR